MTEGTSSAPWSPTRFPTAPRLHLVPGVVLKGANIAAKPEHGATGHAYRAMFAEWDWDGWIRPQVDALHGIGGNAVRVIGDLEGVNDGTFTQATYNARWGQLIDYCTSLGMYVYPALGGVSQIAAAGLTIPQVTDTLVAAATYFQTRATRIVGLDVLQESVRRQVADSYALAYAATFTPAIRAVTGLSLTYSNSDAGTEGPSRFITRLWKHVLRPYVDHWDLHTYSALPPELLADAFWGQGEDKPVLIGEFGAPASAGATRQSQVYDAAVAISNRHPRSLHPAGAFSWTVFDQGSGTNAFGMFETDGTPRTHLTSRFQQLPTA